MCENSVYLDMGCHRLITLALSAILPIPLARAQITVNENELFNEVSLKALILDAETHEPISNATFYINPVGDSLISNFTFSDNSGAIMLDKIVPQSYDIHCEMMGYKAVTISKEIISDVDLGNILMIVDPAVIDPSHIEAYQNPMTIKKDTIEYHASTFHVMENAVLEDLLKRLPGLVLDENGNITVNGKSIDKITVGGKTFFLNDPKLVIQSLPAKVVEKILIINRTKKEQEYTGLISANEKENVMDIQLKEEYSDGMFGRLGVDGGASVYNNELKSLGYDEGCLYKLNSMASSSNGKDQLTILGLANNVTPDRGGTTYVIDSSDDFAYKDGLASSIKTGLNYNTERINNIDFNTSVSYTRLKKDVLENMTSDLISSPVQTGRSTNKYQGTGVDELVSANVQVANINTTKLFFELSPYVSIMWNNRDVNTESDSFISGSDSCMGASCSSTESKTFRSGFNWNSGLKSIGGKTKRSITFSGDYEIAKTNGSELLSEIYAMRGANDCLQLLYDTDSKNNYINCKFAYSEPIANNWLIQAVSGFQKSEYHSIVDAMNVKDRSFNAYYSSELDKDQVVFNELMLLQYQKNAFAFSFGPLFYQNRSRLVSKNLGKECNQNDWDSDYSPRASLIWQKEIFQFSFDYSGQSIHQFDKFKQSQLDISAPTRITLGNVYLRSSYLNSFFCRSEIRSKNNCHKIYITPSIISTKRPCVSASWFDDAGIQYIFPVNSKNGQSSLSVSYGYYNSFGSKKNWNLSLNGHWGLSTNTSYQARSLLNGIKIEEFDYSETMTSIWGEPNGQLFYSGESGFEESAQRNFSQSFSVDLQCRLRSLSLRLGGQLYKYESDFSLNPDSNVCWLKYDLNGGLIWHTNNGIQVDATGRYVKYSGFSTGYDSPECVIDFKVSKDIKKATIILSANDILNQHRLFSRMSNSSGITECVSMILGRCVLAGVSFRFGHPSSDSNSRANNAAHGILLH